MVKWTTQLEKEKMILCAKELIKISCQVCQKECVLLVDKKGLQNWLDGKEYIQDALSDLTAGERELLISGTCDDCWKIIWGEYE